MAFKPVMVRTWENAHASWPTAMKSAWSLTRSSAMTTTSMLGLKAMTQVPAWDLGLFGVICYFIIVVFVPHPSEIHNSIHPEIQKSRNPPIHKFQNTEIHKSINEEIKKTIHPEIHTSINPEIYKYIIPQIHKSTNPHVHKCYGLGLLEVK
jgi:hypothetical protein